MSDSSNKRQIFDNKLYAHFITFSVFRRRKLLKLDHPKRIFLGVLNSQLEQQNGRCIGFVLMPDHVHLTVWFPEPGQLSSFMHGLKRKSSFHIRNWYRAESPNYFSEFGEGEHFWQPKYYSFEIHEQPKLEEKLNYIHLNPVRAELVERAIDYKFSSARMYVLNKTVGIPISWID